MLAKKGLSAGVTDASHKVSAQPVMEPGPRGPGRILVRGGSVLYGARDIMEYVDERYTHGALTPVTGHGEFRRSET